ncbi:MAG: hypothetical protein PWQ55_628 [Chloroflexota bacterium]|nr:hypothetical protein [Chloroflexota bacterium]
MTWLDEVFQAFQSQSGPMRLKDIYAFIENNTSRELPESYQAIIRQVIETHSSDSQVFLDRGDFFHSTEGIGEGVWEMNTVDSSIVSPDIADPNLPERAQVLTTRIIRDTVLARNLKLLYKFKCQICGKAIRLINGEYSEAHHIKPLGAPHNGPDRWENILILCPNHHVEFDYGAMAIEPLSKKVIHIDENNVFNGLELFIDRSHRINNHFLKYHLENIYSNN